MMTLHLFQRKKDYSWLFSERRSRARLPLDLPVRLRVDCAFFPGQARDIGAGGVGIRVVEAPSTQYKPMPQVGVGDRGALELFVEGNGIVVRVRVARVQRIRGKANVGLAIDDSEEAVRLERLLAARGIGRLPV